ncbi:hypothetical protein [Streptomyces klenkii]|uniref:hypothetical protein n=1 Tax=Streptomyces klenkii TaxID=1420899 RepID=UPI00342E0C73
MSERGTELYAFIADRLDEEMRQRYAQEGSDAVDRYGDQRREAMALHTAMLDAQSAGDEDEAARHREALADRAAVWAVHPDHPLRAAA